MMATQDSFSVTTSAEIPEIVFTALDKFLETHTQWSQDAVLTAALCLFLMQNGECDRNLAGTYLEILFEGGSHA